jgi:NAD(P)-dependent dehydrogenase (short-subunit alcohol dehydrogenase family)
MNSSRVVLVTGGAKGIGLGISQAFLATGATVIACGRQAPGALPAGLAFETCDVRDAGAVDALFATLHQKYGQLDVLVNNAGGAPFAMADRASPRFHEKIIQLNLLAPLHLAQKANTLMQSQESGGVILFIGSVSALRPSPGTAAYGAAKAGILSLVQSLAVEWAPKVRVAAVSPGLVHTEQSAQHFGEDAATTIPAGRLGEPADVGNACAWLASEAAAYASGSNLVLHGGGERPAFLAAAHANKN